MISQLDPIFKFWVNLFKAKLDALPHPSEIVILKSDSRGRIRPDKKADKKESDISALLRDEKNDDGGFASDAALMKAASKNIIRGGGLDELFEGTKSKAKREKYGAEDEREKNRSRQIARTLDNCRFCYANRKMEDAIVYAGRWGLILYS